MSTALLTISASTASNATGHGSVSTLEAIRTRQSGLRRCDFDVAELDTWIGRVDGVEDVELPSRLSAYDCRNNRLALLALEQDGFTDAVARCRLRYGAGRIGLFLGSSTSGIHTTEIAYRSRSGDHEGIPADHPFEQTHLMFSLTEFVASLLGLEGPALTISTACSSSAKVFATAHRYLAAGFCDAVIVGGVDSLCLTTLYGFNALQLVSPEPCRPWDSGRNGINVAEAAGFALLEKTPQGEAAIGVLGYGESSDAHHIATPHPEGTGAALAMQRALDMAGMESAAIDYINLHGTATRTNDASENAALIRVFGESPPRFSSTKGWTGHSLGAAGITETIICCLAVEYGLLPGTLNTLSPDPALASNLLLDNLKAEPRVVMNNSFGFGGSNCSLILGCAGT